MPNYYTQLPENYKAVLHIDAKSKKVSILFTVFSLVITAASIVVIGLFCDLGLFIQGLLERSAIVPYFVFIVSLFAYIVLHELVHGAAYKVLTHQKLTFGMTLSVTFCGVPDIYTSRKTALISLAAPLTVFSVLFIALMVALHSVSQIYFIIVGLVFSIHLGGCIGDMYMIFLLLTKFTDKRLLMNDTGPAQTLYLPQE